GWFPPTGWASLVGGVALGGGVVVLAALGQTLLELLLRLAQRPGELRELAPTEDEQDDHQHDDQLRPFEECEHGATVAPRPWSATSSQPFREPCARVCRERERGPRPGRAPGAVRGVR